MSRQEMREMGTGLPVVTAWQAAVPTWHVWRSGERHRVGVGCPRCRKWSTASEEVLGTVHGCPHCSAEFRVNSFVTIGDWRRIAAAR